MIKSIFVPTDVGIKDVDAFTAMMRSAAAMVLPGYHYADNMFTWGRNNSMFDDGEFMNAWQANLSGSATNAATVWRRYILACAAYHCVQLEGDFVECDCYAGDGVKTVVDYLGGHEFPKNFWAFDLFEHADSDPHHSMPLHDVELFNRVTQKFTGYSNVHIIKGRVPDILAEHSPGRIAYLHLDLNQIDSEIGALDVLFERIVPAGVLILDDYEWALAYRGQKIAEDPWFEARNYRVFPLPTGQGLVIKR